MSHQIISPLTTASLILFIAGYTVFLVRAKIRETLDIYDFALLSAVIVWPAFTILFPATFEKITSLMGVKFPFTVLFGLLFVSSFILFTRLASQQKKNEKRITAMAQEIALLKLERSDNLSISNPKSKIPAQNSLNTESLAA